MIDTNAISREILCDVLNCGYADLPTLFSTQIDVATYIKNGITDFNEILRYGFFDKVNSLGLGDNGDNGENDDFRIETNYMCTDIYVKNRNKYDASKLEALENFMHMDLFDIE